VISAAACILIICAHSRDQVFCYILLLLLFTVSVVIFYTTLPSLLLYIYFITLFVVCVFYAQPSFVTRPKDREHYNLKIITELYFYLVPKLYFFLFLSKNLKVKVPCFHSRANNVCLRVRTI